MPYEQPRIPPGWTLMPTPLDLAGKLFLAPMAGVTDLAFRTVCAELGADVTVTEMVSSRALCYQDKKSVSLLGKTPRGLCGAQIFGNDPAVMARAAKLALDHSGCDYIDLNMGCPMPKIAGSGDGCGLMKTPDLAADIVSAVKDAVDVPVTVKCRKGWDKGSVNVVEFACRMEEHGADAICVHGRTRVQPPRPPLAERVDVALRQFELAEADKGERIACLEARKHFAWYLRGVPYANYYKEKISNVSSMAEIYAVAEGVKRDLK